MEKISYSGSLTSLRKILQKIGFIFAKVDGRPFLMERNDITAARNSFLRDIREVKRSDSNIIYLDEMCVNQNDMVKKCRSDRSKVKQATRKGSRLAILHAGTKNGFVQNAELIFQAKDDWDFHNQMNASLFEEWFRNQLLPNIPPRSVIVMDNAACHSVKLEKRPNTSWSKAELRDWLMRKGVQPEQNATKAQLHELAKGTDVSTVCVIDKIAEEAGHRVLRLPPFHYQYNPIERIYAQVKSNVSKNSYCKVRELKCLVEKSLSLVTPSDWMDAVQHVDQLHDKDAKRDAVIEKFMESFITNITEDSDSEISDN